MAITKAIFAEKLMEEMDLTKDEAKNLVELFLVKSRIHWNEEKPLSFRGLVSLNCGIRLVDLAGILKRARIYRFRLGG
jgi:nucleoid DNA-binding protein